MLDTLGFTCVAFVAGALALFAPEFMSNAYTELGIDSDSKRSVYHEMLSVPTSVLPLLRTEGRLAKAVP